MNETKVFKNRLWKFCKLSNNETDPLRKFKSIIRAVFPLYKSVKCSPEQFAQNVQRPTWGVIQSKVVCTILSCFMCSPARSLLCGEVSRGDPKSSTHSALKPFLPGWGYKSRWKDKLGLVSASWAQISISFHLCCWFPACMVQQPWTPQQTHRLSHNCSLWWTKNS